MFEKLDRLILSVNDMEMSANFYKNFLGLKQIVDRPRWKTFKLGDCELGLRPWTPGTEDERRVKHGFVMAFNVPDVDQATRELKEKGAPILVEPRDEDFGRYSEIADPDGYIIMLLSENSQG